MFDQNTDISIHLHIVFGCFHVSMVEMSTYDKHGVVYRDQIIYCLFLYGRSLLTLVRHSKDEGHICHYQHCIRISEVCLFFFFPYFIFGCVGSSFLCEGFLQLRQAEVTLHHDARASHYRGLSCCGAQAPDAQAQQLWFTDLVAPRHVGSSQTRARTHVPCISRQTLNHCTTKEALRSF